MGFGAALAISGNVTAENQTMILIQNLDLPSDLQRQPELLSKNCSSYYSTLTTYATQCAQQYMCTTLPAAIDFAAKEKVIVPPDLNMMSCSE